MYTVHDSGEGWNGTGDWMHFEGYYRDGQFNAAADGNRYDVTSGNIQIHFASYSTANAARRTTTAPPGLRSGGRSSVLAISPRARSRSPGRRVRAVRARRSRPLRWSLSRVLGAQGRHVGHSSRPFDSCSSGVARRAPDGHDAILRSSRMRTPLRGKDDFTLTLRSGEPSRVSGSPMSSRARCTSVAPALRSKLGCERAGQPACRVFVYRPGSLEVCRF